ncbi:ring-1,2-phenylacetyl-CoA epoxidase subunit PaaD [Raineyella antarctica]|uniref:Ring-1,2-phenylacetyl-CoA epoxidase subunit PaaD n=1 Tax=Raineyella antarctica TaxID=1577474 RepID=A0A1G6GFA5_9ACTN|nr:1,2-phenylacetyl-CoA epoxidase subunit PaaD [Raineyella antarctica]SDB80644.1 ring-1,2-phenylacetyl-CoA epoxidase subunit PaaD [Raineyella antarctica]
MAPLNAQAHPSDAADPDIATRPVDPAAGAVWDLLSAVHDPEIPVLTIADIGILRRVEVAADGHPVVTITPTYSGCPAMDTISQDIHTHLAAHGHPDAEVRTVLLPAWTTDWMTEDGRTKLEAYGIAPPTGRSAVHGSGSGPISLTLSVRCPNCGSTDTREMSHFGSTSCKALWVCQACAEPFDHFKVH